MRDRDLTLRDSTSRQRRNAIHGETVQLNQPLLTNIATLRAAWVLASRARSSLTLWLDRTTDVLPVERSQLEGVARIMGYPPGSATRLEDDYLQVTRRARAVFERGFYGVETRREPTTG